MSKPSSPADFGAVTARTGSNAAPGTRSHHPRFAQVRAVLAGTMPTLRTGQVWEDMDPRCAGRTLLIETIRADGTVTARTLTPRTAPARTKAFNTMQTVGNVHTLAAVRFRPGSRGFRLTGALIRLRPDGTVVNADTIKATLGEVALKPVLAPVTLARDQKVTRSVAPKLVVPKPVAPKAKPVVSAALGVNTGGTLVVASLLDETPNPADVRVAAALCGLLGSQEAAQWLVSSPVAHLLGDYKSFGPRSETTGLLVAATRHANVLNLLDKR
ncbi:hypothetical protein [Tessaracoccus sp.]